MNIRPIFLLILVIAALLLGWLGLFWYADRIVIQKVNAAVMYLKTYYNQNGYYPSETEFVDFTKSEKLFPSPRYQSYNREQTTGQTFSFFYHLPSRRNRSDAPGTYLQEWGFYRYHQITSCDIGGLCPSGHYTGIKLTSLEAPGLYGAGFSVGSNNNPPSFFRVILGKNQELIFASHIDPENGIYKTAAMNYDSQYLKSLKVLNDDALTSPPAKIQLVLQAIKEGTTTLAYQACLSGGCRNVFVDVVIATSTGSPRVDYLSTP